MAFLHCHNCGWEQDDFWSEQYNPIRFLTTIEMERELLTANLDAPFKAEPWGLDETGIRTKRTVIVRVLRNTITKIENMLYRTLDEYKENNPAGACPSCAAELDID